MLAAGPKAEPGPEVIFPPRRGTTFAVARPPREAQIQQQQPPDPRPSQRRVRADGVVAAGTAGR